MYLKAIYTARYWLMEIYRNNPNCRYAQWVTGKEPGHFKGHELKLPMLPGFTLAYMFELIKNHASKVDLPWYEEIPDDALVGRCWCNVSPEKNGSFGYTR